MSGVLERGNTVTLRERNGLEGSRSIKDVVKCLHEEWEVETNNKNSIEEEGEEEKKGRRIHRIKSQYNLNGCINFGYH